MQVVVIEGGLDSASAGVVRHRLHAAVDRGSGDLVIDLGAVETIDVNGLGVLVGTRRKAARAGRPLALRAVPPRVMRVLVGTRLYSALPVEPAPAVA
jgi:anti-sigma B factor antagonist